MLTNLIEQLPGLLLEVEQWSDLWQFNTMSAGVVYLIMALAGTALFVIKLVLMIFGGDGGVDGDFDSDLDHADGTFTFISLHSILGFLMGTGWMGLACRLEFGLSVGLSILVSIAFGFVLMAMVSFIMFQVKKLTKIPSYDMATAMGKTAKVYLTIPEKGSGRGQIQLIVDGRDKILDASSTSGSIASFKTVRVVQVNEDESVVVEPVDE